MNAYSRPAPRGFRWIDTPAVRAALAVLIVVSLGLSIYASARYIGLVNCLQRQATADAVRTKRIADATDIERRSDSALIAGAVPGGPSSIELRRAAIDARAHTDRVRAENPAPSGAGTSCH